MALSSTQTSSLTYGRVVTANTTSNSTGNSATAIGASSSSGYENSTAIGHQATTTAVNTQNLMTINKQASKNISHENPTKYAGYN